MLESRTARIVVALVAVALIVVLFVVLGDDGTSDDDGAPQPTATTQTEGTEKDQGPATDPAADVPVIEIKDGEPVGGVTELSFNKGDDIQFTVDSDTADEVHFHGYDVAEDIEAGGTVEFDVPADIEGIFEVELESTATQIAEITVNP